jgi:hypothetical protein
MCEAEFQAFKDCVQVSDVIWLSLDTSWNADGTIRNHSVADGDRLGHGRLDSRNHNCHANQDHHSSAIKAYQSFML